MAEKRATSSLTISLFYSPAPRQVLQKTLSLPAGCTAAQALVLSGIQDEWALGGNAFSRLGVWNKTLKAPADYVLQEGDRLEIYRPLRVDPMTARRERFKTQGARSAGLFAQRRPGAKPGY